MHVFADARALGHRRDDRLEEVLRVRAREPDPLDARDRVARPQELAELRAERRSKVASPRVHVLAEKGDLSYTFGGKPRHLGDDVAWTAALLAPADGRDDAVRAGRVTSHRNLNPGLEARSSLLGEIRCEMLVRPEAAAVDRIASRRDPVAEVRDGTRPERDVDEGIPLENALPLRLGITPADRYYEVRPASLECRRVSEVRGKARVGLLADGAGVEHDDVRLLGGLRLAETERLEHPLDALRVVHVHLAAERRDVVAAHQRAIVGTPAS